MNQRDQRDSRSSRQDLPRGRREGGAKGGVDTATARKIVGHKSEKMWKRYNAIEERDLTQAAQKVHKYLQENKLGTLAETIVDYLLRK